MATPSKFVGKEWKYFILNDELHMVLRVNRGQDEATVWNFPQKCRMTYPKSTIMKYGEKAIRAKDAAEMLGRHQVTLARYHREGVLPIPHRSYSLREGFEGRPGTIFYGKKDVLRALKILASIHQGRPRQDGLVTCQTLPTESEIKAELDYGLRLYAQTQDGKLVRVWEADKIVWR